MLVIRDEQMKVFSEYMVQQFEDRMVVHLESRFPDRLKERPEADIRALIRDGIDKAAAYGIIMEDDVERYLEFMVVYGPDFDTNPDISWAGETLRRENLAGSVKIERLDLDERRRLRG